MTYITFLHSTGNAIINLDRVYRIEGTRVNPLSTIEFFYSVSESETFIMTEVQYLKIISNIKKITKTIDLETISQQ
jgi:hypothetical protein